MYKITFVTFAVIAFSLSCRSANIQDGADKPAAGHSSRDMSRDMSRNMSRDMSRNMSRDMSSESDVSSAVSYQEDMPDMAAVMMQCNDTYRTDMSYLISLNESGNFVDETDKTPKCFIRCVLQQTRVSPAEGRFDPARAAAVFAGARAGRPMAAPALTDMAARCAADREETCKCERAYAFLKCLMQMEIEKYEMNEQS